MSIIDARGRFPAATTTDQALAALAEMRDRLMKTTLENARLAAACADRDRRLEELHAFSRAAAEHARDLEAELAMHREADRLAEQTTWLVVWLAMVAAYLAGRFMQ